jgi:tRNA 2-thiouridine synthesizing protein A
LLIRGGLFESEQSQWLKGECLSDLADCFMVQVAAEVDARGLLCPLPLLKAKQALRNMAEAELLRVLATDAGSVRDFNAYVRLGGHEMNGFAERDGVYCYVLKKGVAPK